MKHIISFLVITLLFSNSFNVAAQSRTIKGIVTTFDSIPLIGAEIVIQSSKEKVSTDTLGQFTAVIDATDKIKVRAKGFYSQNVKIDEKIKMVLVNLKLRPTDKAKEYAVGYGYVKDEERLNALAQLTNDDLNFSQYTNMYDLIRGRFAGVVVQPNGEIIIRGVNSINLSSSALIVVDGMPTNNSILETLSPNNVKSINVIKDGSSAIYGSRGGNGVIVIETKKGGD